MAMVMAVTFYAVPNSVNAEGTEPVMNFYIERELSGHSDDVTALVWSDNGQWLASGSLDNSTIIRSTGTWSTIKTLNHPAPVIGMAFSENSLRLAVSHGNGTIDVWNSIGWSLIQTLSDHTCDVKGIDWSPDATTLSTGDSSGDIIIWDTTTWNPLTTLGMPGAVNDVQWSNSGDRIAACSSDGTISIWDTSSWSYLQNHSVGGYSAESIAWSPDDTRFAASSGEDKIRVWDTASWGILQILDTNSTPSSLKWSSDDTFLASNKMGGIQAWGTTEWNVVDSEETTEPSQVEVLAIHPDADRIASSSPQNTDNNIVIWKKNLSPVLDPIGNQSALEDEPFDIIISASDDEQVTFADDTELFDIDPETGEIVFVPTNNDVGEHTVNISVADGNGGSDNESFTFTIINVDDAPVAIPKWRYGADYVNITVMVGGQPGNSVALVINEDEMLLHEITVLKQSGSVDDGRVHLLTDLDKSYEILLNYSGSAGENPVAVSFEHDGIHHTQHYLFDTRSGAMQVENLRLDDFFSAMGLVVFDGTESVDVDNEIVRYSWDFGDGTSEEGEVVVHAFSENGNYNASLRIESDNGINSTAQIWVFPDGILDEDDLKSVMDNDISLEFLETTNNRAVFIDSQKNLRMVDDLGHSSGWTGSTYAFDVDGVYLAYASLSGEIYYIPNDMNLTYNIIDTQDNYEIDLLVPSPALNIKFTINGEIGGDTIELSQDVNTVSIYTDNTQHNYSLGIEAESTSGREIFTLPGMAIDKGARHSYNINNWEDLTTDPKAVTLAIDNEDDGEIDVTVDLKNGMTGDDVEAIIVAKGKGAPPFLTTSGMILLVGFVSMVGIGFLLSGTEVGKLALISLILPLYTRIRKEDVLDNEIRGMIRGYIIANPGDNYNSIKRALGLNNGALAHHLRVLEKAELIKSRMDGMFKRFYPAGMRIPQENGGEISEIQSILLGKVAESPGISQKEIAVLLKLSKGVINYHVKVLFSKQLLKMEKKGRKTLCYINPEAMRLIKNTYVRQTKEV